MLENKCFCRNKTTSFIKVPLDRETDPCEVCSSIQLLHANQTLSLKAISLIVASQNLQEPAQV